MEEYKTLSTYKLTIYCKTFPTLKNSKQFRLNKKTGKMFLSASNDFAVWYQDALWQAKQWKIKTKYPFPFKRCSISMICFFPDMRNHDLDGIVSGIQDILKTPRKKNDKGIGVIQDDDWKLLRPVTLDAGISKETPRIEVFITPIEDLSIRTK